MNAVPVYGSDQVYTAGSTTQVYMPLSSYSYNKMIDGLLAEHEQLDGKHKTTLITSRTEDTAPDVSSDYLLTYDASATALKKVKPSTFGLELTGGHSPVGSILPYAGRTAPTNWLLCYGQNVSRATYSTLFNVISPSVGTFTITIAAPGVVTLTSHGMVTGDQVYLTTTGALPTGLTANTLYYVVYVDANSFSLATSRANAVAGTKITTTGTQSGTHTLYWCPYGLGDGSTTFTIPDFRGRVLAGADAMGGTAATRLNLAQTQGSYGQVGASGGAQGHTLVTAELASHSHSGLLGTAANGSFALTGATVSNTGSAAPGNTGSDTAHNNVQPTLVANYIIRT